MNVERFERLEHFQVSFQDSFGQFRSRQPRVVAFILGKVLHALKLFDRQHVLGRLPIQAFGIHVQPARRLLGGAVVHLLPFAAEQPIEKHFCRIGVRRAFNETENAIAAADVSAFF